MSQPFLSEISMFGFNFAPKGWALCSGQLMSIQQNQALFALLGTTYGGDGQTTFGLPNLQSCGPIGFGQGPGLPLYNLGQTGGEEYHALTVSEMPSHTHSVIANPTAADLSQPTGNFFGGGTPATHTGGGHKVFSSPADTTLAPQAVKTAGGNVPHNNLPPLLAVNFCIAITGIFPARN